MTVQNSINTPIKEQVECSFCHRLVWLDENGFLMTHREDPPSSVICYMSGTYHLIAD